MKFSITRVRVLPLAETAPTKYGIQLCFGKILHFVASVSHQHPPVREGSRVYVVKKVSLVGAQFAGRKSVWSFSSLAFCAKVRFSLGSSLWCCRSPRGGRRQRGQ